MASFIRAVINMGSVPLAPEAMSRSLFRDLLRYFRGHRGGHKFDVGNISMAAAVSVLMAGSCRF